jgi:hypothetical protein
MLIILSKTNIIISFIIKTIAIIKPKRLKIKKIPNITKETISDKNDEKATAVFNTKKATLVIKLRTEPTKYRCWSVTQKFLVFFSVLLQLFLSFKNITFNFVNYTTIHTM